MVGGGLVDVADKAASVGGTVVDATVGGEFAGVAVGVGVGVGADVQAATKTTATMSTTIW